MAAGAYNPLNNVGGGNDFQNQSPVENRGVFSRILRNLSSWGMNYDQMVMRNQIGINKNEDPNSLQKDASMYSMFSQKAVANVLSKKSIPYLDRSYVDKKRLLREYSIKDEIRDFVTTISDEIIIYNDDKDFCYPKPLPNEYSQDITDKYQEVFEKVYNKYGFHDGITAWNMVRDFLIDGYVAIEMVYDDKKKNIIHYNPLKPETLVPAFEPAIGNLWIQYPEDPQNKRILLDSQIIYISYSTQAEFSEVSYVEGLIKPYNHLKIIEQTRILFNIINATVYQKFVIPIKGLPKHRAEEQIGQLIQDYAEEVEWDDYLGTVQINGKKHLPYNKQVWFPEGDAGTPNMELVSPQGHNLNENDMLTWFLNVLKRASKIPFQRFEKENGGGNIFSDAAEMTRDEVKFSNFVNRLRANLKELIVKPIRMQMLIEFPELMEDERFVNSIDIIFYSNDIFEEWKKLNNMSKRADILNSMLGIQNGEKPYFHIDFLMDHVFKLSPEDKEENKKYWLKDSAGAATPGEGTEGGGEFGGGGGEAGGGEFGGGETGGEAGVPPPEIGGGEAGGGAPPEGGGGEAGGGEEFEF